jgi:hypothetical protein
MIIFVDEEHAYRMWIAHHRAGFVLDALRGQSSKHLVLHRATCPEIKHSASKRTHWTTGNRMKLCAFAIDELRRWSEEHLGGRPMECDVCRPGAEAALTGESSSQASRPWTQLGREIMTYVLDVAVIHLDNQDAGYHVTVGDLAVYLSKSVRQITPTVLRLAEGDDLSIAGSLSPGTPLSARHTLVPTAKALRTVPAFAGLTEAQLQSLIAQLARPPSLS